MKITWLFDDCESVTLMLNEAYFRFEVLALGRSDYELGHCGDSSEQIAFVKRLFSLKVKGKHVVNIVCFKANVVNISFIDAIGEDKKDFIERAIRSSWPEFFPTKA